MKQDLPHDDLPKKYSSGNGTLIFAFIYYWIPLLLAHSLCLCRWFSFNRKWKRIQKFHSTSSNRTKSGFFIFFLILYQNRFNFLEKMKNQKAIRISIFKEIWNFLNQRHYGILKYLNLTKLKILPKYQFYKIGHSDVSHCCFLLQKCDLRTKLTRSETHTFYCRLVNELSYSPNGIGQYLPWQWKNLFPRISWKRKPVMNPAFVYKYILPRRKFGID